MTKGDKQLLLKDLCARLPYGVKCQYDCIVPGVMEIINAVGELQGIVPFGNTIGFMIDLHRVNALYDNVKPYLRPLESMTEEEYNNIDWEGCRHVVYYDKNGFRFVKIGSFTIPLLDYLNARHFDFRYLIEKGLALEAPEGMYKNE